MRNLFLLLFILASFASAFSQNNSSANTNEGNLNETFLASKISEPYPVPSSNFVSFDYKDIVGGVIEIYSMNGARIKKVELKARSGKIVLSVRNFSTGVFIYKISDFTSNVLKSGKIVVVE